MYKIIKKGDDTKVLFLVFCFNLSEKSQQNFISVLAPLATLLFFSLESICGMLNMVLVVTNHTWLFIFKLITIKYNLKIQFLSHTKHVKCTWPVVTVFSCTDISIITVLLDRGCHQAPLPPPLLVLMSFCPSAHLLPGIRLFVPLSSALLPRRL